jgi:hypothetical protein
MTTKDGRPRATKGKRPKAASAEILDRPPPQDLDAERAVLGAIACGFMKPATFDEILGILGPEHFSDFRHVQLFSHFLRMRNEGKPIDPVTLAGSLSAAGLSRQDEADYLTKILQSVGAPSNAPYYAKMVRDKADRRALLRLGERALQLGDGDGEIQAAHAELRELLDPEADKPAEPPRFTRLLTSADLAGLEEKPQFLVRGVMVAGQPMVIGGRSKSLKTSIAIDLALSLGSGTAFLGKFASERVNVGAWSGESGAATVRETALRVAAVKGVNLADCSVWWSFDLPRLWQATDLDALRCTILQRGIQVAIIDPLYLCLLSGDTAGTASNLFAMGSVLQPLSAFAQEAGVTLVLVHHFRKTGQSNDAEPAGLEELAQSGAAEFAREWILLQRRSPFQGDGRHSLWVRTGGSAGHAGLWALDVDEGMINPDTFEAGGGRWRLSRSVMPRSKPDVRRRTARPRKWSRPRPSTRSGCGRRSPMPQRQTVRKPTTYGGRLAPDGRNGLCRPSCNG